MTDDAELRARIEAQVAARRARGAPPKGQRSAAQEPGDDPGDAGPRRPSGLIPTRPWAPADGSPPPPATDDSPGGRGAGPLRPWRRRGSDAAESPTVRPPEPPRPTPSSPETVLRGMAAAPPPGNVPVDAPAHSGAVPRHAAGAPALPSAEAAGDGPDAAEPALTPRRPLLSRLFKRGDDYEPYEKFTLPEPDASFERPWRRPAYPSPTREWAPPRAAGPAPVDLTKSEPSARPAPAGRPRPPLGISGVNSWGTSHAMDRPPAPDDGRAPHPTGPAPGAALTGAAVHTADRSKDDAEDAGDDDQHSGRRVTQRVRRLLVRTLVIVVIATIAAVLLRTFVVQPFYIPSESMEPTLHGCTGCKDDRVLVDKLSYRAHDIRAGDIVVFHRPPDAPTITDRVLIKRVIGRPGDVVELRRGRVYVNGRVLDEPYVNKACGPNATTPLNGRSKWTVPTGDVFVMGDNRCHSADSRVFGPIASSSVIGRAFAIIWPIGRIRLL